MKKRAWAIKLGSGGSAVDFCERHRIVGVGWKDLVEQPGSVSLRQGENTEAQVQNIDASSLIETPSMAHRGWKGHLPR